MNKKPSFATRDKLIYFLTGLFVVSFAAQLLLTRFDYRMSLMTVFLQLIVAWVTAQLFFRFLNKQNYSSAGLWMSWYLFIIIGSVIIHFIDKL